MSKPLISMVEVQLTSFIEAKRPADPEIRKQLDYGYSWDGQTALLFEIRPQWDDPTKILELPFAKLRFVKSSKIWKLYWMRGSGNGKPMDRYRKVLIYTTCWLKLKMTRTGVFLDNR